MTECENCKALTAELDTVRNELSLVAEMMNKFMGERDLLRVKLQAAPGDVLRECMAIFNGPPDQPDGNGMNAVIRIARRGMITLEQVREALAVESQNWTAGKTFSRRVLARLSPAQEQK